MSIRFLSLTVVLFTTGPAVAQLLAPPTAPHQIVIDAANVLTQSVAMPSGLPQKMIADAQGVAIVPNMVRGAFVIGLERGRGVLVVRGPEGAWQAPRMIEITGGSLGYQIGVQSTDLILVFRTQQSVANVMRGTLKVGVDASAAAGPVGRQASAATDLPLQTEILSYSRARGAFVGASIDGSSI
jgi:lipid-binding SYLF domain-containing protein